MIIKNFYISTVSKTIAGLIDCVKTHLQTSLKVPHSHFLCLDYQKFSSFRGRAPECNSNHYAAEPRNEKDKVVFTQSVILPVVISALIFGCGGPDHLKIPKPAPYDMHNVQEPAEREINYLSDGFEKQVIDEIADIFDILGHYRKNRAF